MAVTPYGGFLTGAFPRIPSSPPGGPATSAQIYGPIGVAAVPGGGFLIADWGNRSVGTTE